MVPAFIWIHGRRLTQTPVHVHEAALAYRPARQVTDRRIGNPPDALD